VDFLLSHSKNYIMDYSYYADWVAPACFNEHTDNIYVSSVYLYWHLKLISELAGIAGKEDDKKYYSEKAEKSKLALNDKYFDKKTCNYESGTQAADSLALSLEIVPEEYKKRVAENIYNNVLKFNHHSTCGNVGYRHLFYCLCDYGHIDEALNILANPEYPGWGYMLKNGATSVWERWESEMSNEMDSFDHPMFASYDAVFYRYLGGICIDDKACGADKVSINPQIAENIDYVNCSFETVRGKIVSNWKKVNGKVNYRIEIPVMTTAEITVGGKTYSVGCGVYDYEI